MYLIIPTSFGNNLCYLIQHCVLNNVGLGKEVVQTWLTNLQVMFSARALFEYVVNNKLPFCDLNYQL